MRKAARVIVVKDQDILVMKRNKFGMIYYCLIGGQIELGEEPVQAALREAKEETGLDLTNPRLVYVEEAGAPYGTQYIFLADYQGGEVKLSPDSVEAAIAKDGKNLFEPMWLPISKLSDVPFRSSVLQQKLVAALASGFPAQPEQFRSQAEINQSKTQEES